MDTLLADLISGDESLAESAMEKLVVLGAKALPAVFRLFDSPDPDQRWWILSTLAQIEEVDTKFLLNALDDDALAVRQSAALGLAAHPCPELVDPLISILSDPDAMLVSLAKNALVAIGADAVLALVECYENETTRASARIAIIRALAEISDQRAIPTLMKALESDSALAAYWAEIGLENLGLDMVYMKLD